MTDYVKEKLPDDIILFLKNNKLKLKKLSKPNVFISLGQIAIEYFLIFSSIYLCLIYWSIPFYILTLMFIGARQVGLGVLMHDATHFLLCKNKKINDLICNLFISYPLFFPLSKYRNVHYSHHANLLTEDDPDWHPRFIKDEWKFPQSKTTFLKNLLQYSFYIHAFKIIFNFKISFRYKINYILNSFIPMGKLITSNFKKISIGIILLICVSLMFYFKFIFYIFLFWIFPILFWIPFINNYRLIAEHFGIEGNQVLNKSRTIYPNLVDILFFGCEWNVTYHLDHHIYPRVPSYRLKKLHNMIKDLDGYKQNAHITKNGFYGVFKECTI